LSAALSKASIDAPLAESIALAVAELNGCDYCLAAHSFISTTMMKMDPAVVARAREGHSHDPRHASALQFARRVSAGRGRVDDDDIQAMRAAGFNDAQIVEITMIVAANHLTNFVNNVAHTDLDFPAVSTHSHD
jgi:alkylhydroperoxidase family enzyme